MFPYIILNGKFSTYMGSTDVLIEIIIWSFIYFSREPFDIAQPGVDAVLETVSSFLLTCSVEKFILTSWTSLLCLFFRIFRSEPVKTCWILWSTADGTETQKQPRKWLKSCLLYQITFKHDFKDTSALGYLEMGMGFITKIIKKVVHVLRFTAHVIDKFYSSLPHSYSASMCSLKRKFALLYFTDILMTSPSQ